MQYGQLHHVEYYVNDLEKTKSFWGWFLSLMDYTEFQKWPDGISYAHTNGTYLVFVQVLREFVSIANNRQAAGLNHIAFKGRDETSLLVLEKELRSRNDVHVLKVADDALCFEDSNGFAVEIFL